jgi:uncharacterized Tic20 family protein
MSENRASLSVEERLLAALSHGSILAQGVGLLVGVLVYVTQREKSRYAAFQALQAAVFQLINLIIVMGLWLVWGVFYGLSMIPLIRLSETAPDAPPPPIFWWGLGSMVLPFAVMVVVGLVGLWGALRSWQGREFRYPLLGAWLERSGLWKNGGGA